MLACLTSAAQTFALDTCCSESCCDVLGFDSALTFNIGGGYRQDTLKWTTFPASSPGTVIHEKWKFLTMPIVEANAAWLACEHYLLIADFDYGWFCNNGKQSIRTFSLDTDTLIGDVHARTKGHACDISAAGGYQFNWCSNRYSFAPVAGYAYSQQHFTNRSYKDELDFHTPTIHAHNNYTYRWSGPLLGFTAAYQITWNWQIALRYAYHWIRYHAKITERFAADTPGVPVGSLTGHQRSNWGYGNEIDLSTAYEFAPDWLLSLNFNYKYYNTKSGKFSNRVFTSPLRSIAWTTWNVGIDLGYVF